MAITMLNNADHERLPRGIKGGSLITSDSLNCATTFADLVDWGSGSNSDVWFPLGGAPCLAVDFLWTFASGATLTGLVWVSNDPNFVIVKPAYVIRDAGATASNGIVTAFPAHVAMPKGTIADGTGFYTGSGTTLYCGAVWSTEGYRFAKVQIKSDSATGSVIGYASVGTNL